MNDIRVLLVDDHAMVNEALRFMLEKTPGIVVIGEICDGMHVNEFVEQFSPDVVVMDVNMPNVNGIEATRRLLKQFSHLKVVALSAFGHKQFVLAMLDAGALAYVVKSSAGKELVQAITSAVQGKIYICQELAEILIKISRNHSPSTTKENQLGRREIEVLTMLAKGKSSPEIGVELNLATSTVDGHRRNIMQKLDLHSVAELTMYAIQIGLISI